MGFVVHADHTNITDVGPRPLTSYDGLSQVETFVLSFGPLKLDGLDISANGANLNLDRNSGSAFALGSNYENDVNNTSVTSESSKSAATITYAYRSSVAGTFTFDTAVSSVDPTKYDDGDGTPGTVPSDKWTIQRVFYIPKDTNNVYIYYGRVLYDDSGTAAQNIVVEDFDEDTMTASSAVFLGYIIIRGGATALNTTADATFIQGGTFRNTAGAGGGTISLSLNSLSDVNITSATNNQILYYDSGVWKNSFVLSGNIGSGQISVNHLASGVT